MQNVASQMEMIAGWERYRQAEIRTRKVYAFAGFAVGIMVATIFWAAV